MRYLAQRIGGESSGVILDTELPLDNVTRGRALSAPPTASAEITTTLKRLIGSDGLPVIRKWRTAIYPVSEDQIRGGYIVTDMRKTGQGWSLSLAGFTAYPAGQPFNGVKEYVDADPTDIFRDIWDDLQSQPDANLGLQISNVTSPVRVGTGPRDVAFTTGEGEDVAFQANDGSRKLNWWSTFDCGREIDDLASSAPFDWVERHAWDDNAVGGIGHFVDLGYPTLGGRRTHVKLVYGENVLTKPEPADNPNYATDIVFLGAGEGKDRIRGFAGTERTGLRRVKVIEDKDVDSTGQANARARAGLVAVRDQFVVTSVVVERHPNADIDALEPGDEVPFYAELEDVVLDQWVKIVDIQATDDDPDHIVVTVVTA